MTKVYDWLVHWQLTLPKWEPAPRPGDGEKLVMYNPRDHRYFSIGLAGLFLAITFGGPFLIRARRGEADRTQGALLLFMWLNIMYVAFVGNLLETGENNRFRFMIEPFMWIFAAALAEEAIRVGLARGVLPRPHGSISAEKLALR